PDQRAYNRGRKVRHDPHAGHAGQARRDGIHLGQEPSAQQEPQPVSRQEVLGAEDVSPGPTRDPPEHAERLGAAPPAQAEPDEIRYVDLTSALARMTGGPTRLAKPSPRASSPFDLPSRCRRPRNRFA